MGNNYARKTGIAAAAPYIQCVDSDDWIEPEMTERLYMRALKEKLDIVMCDFISYRANGQKCFPFFGDVRGMDKEAILKSLLTDNLSWSLWNKLYAKKLFDGIKFAPYRSFEDVVVIVQLFLNAETFGYECSSLYHWRFNPTSIGNSRKREHINWVEGYKNTQIIKDILIERGVYHTYEREYKQRLRVVGMRKNRPLMFVKRAAKALIPYGLFKLYRYLCDKP